MKAETNYADTVSADERSTTKWSVLLLLVLAYGLYNLDKNVIAILIEPIKAEFGLSDLHLGLLTGVAATVPFALACIPLGLLADRVNRKWLLIALITGWSLMTGVAGLATSVAVLFVSRVGVGTFESGFTPISMSVLSDSFPRRQRSTAMGIFSLGAPLGIFLGMAVGGYVASILGWRAAFFIAGAPGLLMAIIIAVAVREPVRGRYDPPSEHKRGAPLSAVLRNMWQDRALLHISIGMTCCAVLLAALAIWIPSFLIRVHGVGLAEAGLAAAIIAGVCGASGAAAGGILADRLGRTVEWRRLIGPVAGVSLSIVFALLGFLGSTDIVSAVLLLGPAAFFGQFYIGTGYAMASTLAPTNMRAATISILLVLFNLISYGLGSTFVGIVSDALLLQAGNKSLAYGLALATAFSVWGMLHFWRALAVLRERS